MTENLPAPKSTHPTTDIPGQPFYDKSRLHLQELIRRKQAAERVLAKQEEEIYKKEGEYLEDTPHGNIIIGFEGYVKGVGALAGQRRGAQRTVDGNRVFSRSSVSFLAGGMDSPMDTAQSTPLAATAPTPLSMSFVKGDGASNHATPTSATSANKSGAGNKKNNKRAGGGDDSDGEGGKDAKKARTNFGAARK